MNREEDKKVITGGKTKMVITTGEGERSPRWKKKGLTSSSNLSGP